MRFHPVVVLPSDYDVLDLTGATWSDPKSRWSIGRYDEDRNIYGQALFAGARTVHVGVDIGGPEGTAVHAFAAGEVVRAGVNPADGDYGPTLVTAHEIDGEPLFVLLGHLSSRSLARSPVGRCFEAGDVLGWLGDEHENGGWPPHVHVQLANACPDSHDLPGVVSRADRAEALARYPDPRRILGPLY